eukprot:gene16605-35152_t
MERTMESKGSCQFAGNARRPKIEISPWDHRLTVPRSALRVAGTGGICGCPHHRQPTVRAGGGCGVAGVLLLAGGVLLIPCEQARRWGRRGHRVHVLPYADHELGDINMWNVDWDLTLLRRSGGRTAQPSQWKYHVMRLCGQNWWHRKIADDIITMKLQNEGRLDNKTATAWSAPGRRLGIASAVRDLSAPRRARRAAHTPLRRVDGTLRGSESGGSWERGELRARCAADTFLYLQTGLVTALSLSLCGLGDGAGVRGAVLLCLTGFVTTIITIVACVKPRDIDHIVPIAVFGDAGGGGPRDLASAVCPQR